MCGYSYFIIDRIIGSIYFSIYIFLIENIQRIFICIYSQ